jgi:hypothetical protein
VIPTTRAAQGAGLDGEALALIGGLEEIEGVIVGQRVLIRRLLTVCSPRFRCDG